jgi:hypothetical protein
MQPWFVFAFMEAKAFPPAARQAAIESELLAERVLAGIFERGNDRGIFRVADPSATAALVKPLLQDWYVKRGKYRRRGVTIDAYVETVTSFVEAAVARRPAD